MPSLWSQPQSLTDQAELPVAQQVIGEVMKLERQLSNSERAPASAEIATRLSRALNILRGEEPSVVQGAAPELAQTGGREIILKDGSKAIEMHIVFSGQTIRAVFSDASFNKSRSDQDTYATEVLGGRLATRAENRAVARNLLEKEVQGTLNPSETKLLRTYREKYVRDSVGGLGVNGRRVHEDPDLCDGARAYPSDGALVVLPFAESK